MRTTMNLTMAILAVGFSVTGCQQSAAPPAAPETTEVSESGHTHDGWWCSEHGVPEEICAKCSPKLAADFKAKGDWCDKHGVPDSQCFECHPEAVARFAAQYEARYGEQPPALGTPHEHEHEDEHGHEGEHEEHKS